MDFDWHCLELTDCFGDDLCLPLQKGGKNLNIFKCRLQLGEEMQEKGMQEKGMQEKGMQEKGMQEKGMQEKGMQEKGLSKAGIAWQALPRLTSLHSL